MVSAAASKASAPGGCAGPPPAELLRGVRQFNRREFFECHETLEALWKREAGEVRYLYQGILLVGVGFYHLDRGNRVGSRKCLRRGIACLLRVAPVCQGVRAGQLAAEAVEAMATLEGRGWEDLGGLGSALIPTIQIELGSEGMGDSEGSTRGESIVKDKRR